jgi:hypothetical protein
MPYNVRDRFHHPDIARNQFYQTGDVIAKSDEPELEERGLLARFCTYSADPNPAQRQAVTAQTVDTIAIA